MFCNLQKFKQLANELVGEYWHGTAEPQDVHKSLTHETLDNIVTGFIRFVECNVPPVDGGMVNEATLNSCMEKYLAKEGGDATARKAVIEDLILYVANYDEG